MKKILSIVLAVAMLATTALSLTACSGGSGTKASGQVIVGDITELDANMFPGYTNGSTNAKIRTMIFGGYEPVVWTKDNEFVWNDTAVEKHEATENADGSKTYTVTLKDDLTWNDGTDAEGNKKDPTKITAKDYVFGILLIASSQIKSTDGSDTTGNGDFLGYEEYASGESNKMSGVRLIDEMTFAITIDPEQLPFYFDTSYMNIAPYPMFVIAPDCDIKDDGDGAYIDGPFTDDLLGVTMNTSGTGYRYMPKVTSGMYQLESYDDAKKEAVLVANPYFKGTHDGAKAKIERVVIRKVVSSTQFDELAAGTVDLLGPAGGGEEINTGIKLQEEQGDKFTSLEYARAGYGKIHFVCDFGPTQFESVRQAITYCLDRNEFAKQYTGGYGVVVNGPYSLSQWEYVENKKVLDERLNSYAFNTDKAKEVLIADGWTLNKDGGEYDENAGSPEDGNVRYKKLDDGTLMPLIVKWLSTPDDENPVAALINTMLPSELNKVGMKMERTVTEFPVLLEHLYRQTGGAYTGTPEYHMANLASGFVPVPSYWYEYSTDPKYDGDWNMNILHDQKLSDLAQAMKATDPSDREGWSSKWVEFMVRWNELMPDIPLYSNQYYVFYNSKIKDLEMNPLWEWDMALQYASVG